ncbi:MAG: hypothetical protein FJ306_00750 [Planctomycetes bacterium]|nr:hypothetical protein [Planctomycetota bacterium]
MLLGGVGLLAVIGLVVALGGGKKDGDNAAAAATKPPVAAPAAPTPAAAAKAGKTPTKPAPALSAAVLADARTLLADAKALSNEGVQARNAGNNELARQKQSAASDKVEAIKATTAANWAWLEEAELEGWSTSGEYADLGKLYTDLLGLENRIRKGGGTR